MKRTAFQRVLVLMLVSALAFGQVGAGFLHNKHDAHEEVVDLDSNVPVLLNHGEHCKVCAVDWMHQFDIACYHAAVLQTGYSFLKPLDVNEPIDIAIILNNNRAPPFLS